MRGRQAEWTYRLSPPEIVEIETAVKAVQARRLDIADIRRDDFPLPTLGPVLDRLRVEVLDGRGFVLLRGMPVEDRPIAETAMAYWGVGTYFGNARSQNAQGHLLGMYTTSVTGSARPIPICAAMPPRNVRISILTVATSSVDSSVQRALPLLVGRDRKFADSLLEGSGFELPVPRCALIANRAALVAPPAGGVGHLTRARWLTPEGSNPPFSSVGSTNFRFL
jgi:hypothetical protein